MSIALVPGTMSTKAIETIALLKTNIAKGPESTTNSESPFETLIRNVARFAFLIIPGSAVVGAFCATKASPTFSEKPLRLVAGSALVMGVTFLVFKTLLFPYSKELKLINSSKSTFRNLVNESTYSWKKNLFQIPNKTEQNALDEFLNCLIVIEDTQPAKRGSKYLKFINMPKEEAIKAVAVTKIVYMTFFLLHYFAGSDEQSRILQEKEMATRLAHIIESDLKCAQLEPELEARIRYIVHCLKNDLGALPKDTDPATGLTKLSALDTLVLPARV